MTLHRFPDRISQVRAERAVRTTRASRTRAAAVSILKSCLTLWLLPGLFWLTLIESLDDDADAGPEGGYD